MVAKGNDAVEKLGPHFQKETFGWGIFFFFFLMAEQLGK